MVVKNKFLLGFVIGTVLFGAVSSVPVNAAQVWNNSNKNQNASQEREKPDSNQYFNAPNAGTGRIGKNPYYNEPQNNYPSYANRFKSEAVTMRKTETPKQYEYLSPTAIRNRNSDTSLALKREYKLNQKVLAFQKQAIAKNASDNARNVYEHQKRVAEYVKDREELKERQKIEKRRDYYALVGHKDPTDSAGGRVAKPKSDDNKYGLKKPKKLYNDPNL
ncbi:MAG: hypothetical protein GC137_08180 [Alphaproteobacteria bacterium]|nr:hypothetical protein [Alphaproteobacteria bacterium]